MEPSLDLLLFTVGPLVVMAAALAYTVRGIHRLSDLRPFLLVALLGLMMLHQATELAEFSGLGVLQSHSRPAEAFESGANVLASVASYFVVQHLEELRAAEVELEASNATLRQRSAMVNVLNRILRHNVRNDVNVVAGQADDAATRVDDEVVLAKLELIRQRAWGLARISDQTRRIRHLLAEEPNGTTALRFPEALREPIETVVADAPSATVTLEGPDDPGLPATATATFPLVVADVLEQIIAHNDGAVAVEVRVSSDPGQSDDDGPVTIGIDDDGDGLPDLDVQAIERGDETPLVHAEGLALWCLSWTVERVGGTLDVRSGAGTLEIHLPRSPGGVTD